MRRVLHRRFSFFPVSHDFSSFRLVVLSKGFGLPFRSFFAALFGVMSLPGRALSALVYRRSLAVLIGSVLASSSLLNFSSLTCLIVHAGSADEHCAADTYCLLHRTFFFFFLLYRLP